MVLTENDLDEIGDKVRDVTIEVLQLLEQKYIQTLGGVQKDIWDLQIQATKLQVNVGKVSGSAGGLT